MRRLEKGDFISLTEEANTQEVDYTCEDEQFSVLEEQGSQGMRDRYVKMKA